MIQCLCCNRNISQVALNSTFSIFFFGGGSKYPIRNVITFKNKLHLDPCEWCSLRWMQLIYGVNWPMFRLEQNHWTSLRDRKAMLAAGSQVNDMCSNSFGFCQGPGPLLQCKTCGGPFKPCCPAGASFLSQYNPLISSEKLWRSLVLLFSKLNKPVAGHIDCMDMNADNN